MTFEASRIHFFGDVFAAVAVVPTIWQRRANETEKNITHPFKLFRDYSTLLIYFKEAKLGGKWRN